jgi:3-oxoacyl-[acyl-carrier protein] reductase
MQNERLNGRAALITGAACGIGRAAVRAFVAAGANVAALDVDADRVREAAGDDRVLALGADVTDESAVTAAVAQVREHFGSVDALVHFAGITRDALAAKMTLDQWDAVLRVNLTGSFVVARATALVMSAQGRGSIVLVSSRSAYGNVGQANYSASKAGVIGLTRTLALEFGRDNVRVNAIAPGFVETPMTAVLPEKVRDRIIAATPLHRTAQPEEIASVALFLASDDSSFVTGQTINVDGGRTTGLAPL